MTGDMPQASGPFDHVRLPVANEELVSVTPVVVCKRVAFGDCDPAGIVYTPRFADFVIIAQSWLREVLFDQPMSVELPMRGLTLDFRAMLRVGERFTMDCRITQIQRRTFTISVTARKQGGAIAFIGTLSPIAYAPAENHAVDLPQDIRQRLVAYQRVCDGIGDDHASYPFAQQLNPETSA